MVGAGVIGLTTAICLAEEGRGVLVWYADPPERTTSAVAGAMAGGPVFAEPRAAAERWNETSLREYAALARSPETGVRIAEGRLVSRLGAGIPPWAAALPGFRPCTPEEQAGYAVGFWISTPLIDMPATSTTWWPGSSRRAVSSRGGRSPRSRRRAHLSW